eukprot:4711044-Amphidinium_carterae.1
MTSCESRAPVSRKHHKTSLVSRSIQSWIVALLNMLVTEKAAIMEHKTEEEEEEGTGIRTEQYIRSVAMICAGVARLA